MKKYNNYININNISIQTNIEEDRITYTAYYNRKKNWGIDI